MTISATKLIGAVVKRTMDALNANPSFIEAAKTYEFWPNCSKDGKLQLWHYHGTPDEIGNVLANIGGQIDNAASLKLPAVLDFHPLLQSKNCITDGVPTDRITYNIAIVAPVRKEWLSQTREQSLFEPLLRPVYEEFIRQLKQSPAFSVGYELPHDYYEVFTTGGSPENLAQCYGNCIDAIELQKLSLTIRNNLCKHDLDVLYAEADKVTDNINNILNQ